MLLSDILYMFTLFLKNIQETQNTRNTWCTQHKIHIPITLIESYPKQRNDQRKILKWSFSSNTALSWQYSQRYLLKNTARKDIIMEAEYYLDDSTFIEWPVTFKSKSARKQHFLSMSNQKSRSWRATKVHLGFDYKKFSIRVIQKEPYKQIANGNLQSTDES